MTNKAFLGVGAVLVAAILVGWAVSSNRVAVPESAVLQKEEGAMEKPEAPASAEAPADAKAMAGKSAGKYEPYAPAKLALAEMGKVIIFFRASWCPTCRGLDADIRANLGTIPAGTAILDVNYDIATELKQKYGVTYQHTLVQVDAKGTQIAKWTGTPTLAALLAQVK